MTLPQSAIVMNGDSDLPVMQEAAPRLGEFGVPARAAQKRTAAGVSRKARQPQNI